MAEPTQEGQAPKTPVEVVAQVLPSSKYLQNVGLRQAGPNKHANNACVHELEVEVQLEKQVAACNEYGTIYVISSDFGDRKTTQHLD